MRKRVKRFHIVICVTVAVVIADNFSSGQVGRMLELILLF